MPPVLHVIKKIVSTILPSSALPKIPQLSALFFFAESHEVGVFGSLSCFCSVRTAHHQSSLLLDGIGQTLEVIQPSSTTAWAKQLCCMEDLLLSLAASPWLRIEMMFSIFFFFTMSFPFPFTRSFPKWQIISELQILLTIQLIARLWDLKDSQVIVIKERVSGMPKHWLRTQA